MREARLVIEVSEGAGKDFLDTVLAAVANDSDSVYVQVAGEYGHLQVELAELVEEL